MACIYQLHTIVKGREVMDVLEAAGLGDVYYQIFVSLLLDRPKEEIYQAVYTEARRRGWE